MKIAKVISEYSKDPSTKVGCVIIDENKRIISTGYNGFIAGNDELFMTFERPMKHYLTIHAEMNALLFAKQDLTNKIMYITHSPCSNCLLHIAQSKIKLIYYENLYIPKINPELCIDAINRIIKSTDIRVINYNTNRHYMEEIVEKMKTNFQKE